VAPNAAGSAQVTARDGRLGYIADMARQLEIMAANMSCRTLADLLAVARKEALVQRQVGPNPPSGGV
jgi:hypothetical protein